METRIDPRDPNFDRSALTGTEVLYCPDCGSVFLLDYADALVNKKADRPKNDCCAKMMDVYVEKALRHIAKDMVQSNSESVRKAGETLKNTLPDSQE